MSFGGEGNATDYPLEYVTSEHPKKPDEVPVGHDPSHPRRHPNDLHEADDVAGRVNRILDPSKEPK